MQDTLCPGNPHPTELSTNSVMIFVNIFLSTFCLPYSPMPLLTVRTSGLITSFTTLGHNNWTRSYAQVLRFT